MRGIITNIKRMAVHDGHGLRTTVFFKGCPLRCVWCHNPDTLFRRKQLGYFPHLCAGCGACVEACDTGALTAPTEYNSEKCTLCGKCAESCPISARVLFGEEWEAEALAKKVLADRDFFKASGGGVTLSGGECLSQIDFAVELAKILFNEGISVDIDTSGAVSFDAISRILPYTDEFLYDIKAIDPAVHKHCTGKDNSLILENLKNLDELGARVEIRYPLVPGYNDGECSKIGEFLSGLKNVKRIKVLAYHDLARSKYSALGLTDTLPGVKAVRDDVQKAVDILASFGLEAINGVDGD